MTISPCSRKNLFRASASRSPTRLAGIHSVRGLSTRCDLVVSDLVVSVTTDRHHRSVTTDRSHHRSQISSPQIFASSRTGPNSVERCTEYSEGRRRSHCVGDRWHKIAARTPTLPKLFKNPITMSEIQSSPHNSGYVRLCNEDPLVLSRLLLTHR
jgi:hypothetical protein